MSDINSQYSNTPLPFFARFLEGQFGTELSEAEMASVSGGSEYITLAYPSDVDVDGGNKGYEFPSIDVPSMPSLPEFPKFPSISDYYEE
jgi:Serine endopeptidase inhibitors